MPDLSRCNQWLQRLGHGMRRHAPVIRAVQWAVVLFYALLLVIPAMLPLPDSQARFLDNLTLLAQFLFWGIWWPFVLLSMVLFGRLWCGVLCPEGSLTEWASRYGKGLGVPRWLRWSGWPTLAFCLTTLYGQLISVYDYAQAALLILGGSTVAAVIVGLLFARGKRVWCRYLCPVSGVFALLARLAPVHFKVDEQRWMENAEPRLPPPNCAPLLDIRRLQGASDCHACGRCSGQRGAVRLIARSSNQEILQSTKHRLSPWDARLLLFGVIGLAMGAFQWTVSPWFVSLKQQLASWLVEQDLLWPLQDNAPWWLLTHYPQLNDSFSWLDGFSIITYLALSSMLLGTALLILLRFTARLAGNPALYSPLALTLTPLGGAGLFLGLSATTVKLLRYEGLLVEWVQPTRASLLMAAMGWSLSLGWKLLGHEQVSLPRRVAGSGCLLLANGLVGYGWWLQFWGW
ncbi:4Fe-4S binding protein [Pseudomonas sp. RTC3]|uniref:4Fe-4S binding protein n=1 Tax=unclassified Pseudomonas TaxID=196821 RepID=UPI002AB436DB|nr:4Fe-4S binding protein [Pseudomonas sp. 5C2]MDY7565186.1 4Fe-4S binding protein [Pseudomonas sp. 5C2]MEB0061657.1 4Fe-4S binding protein [Pseudomonas sp. RTC3]MEB0239566.1 4Fe-4S binding protein [Pseudomonas sp. 5C2]